MLKNISNLGKTLSKTEKQSIQGGARGRSKTCSTVCINAPSGTLCDVHSGCPGANDGMCNGQGGFLNL